MYTIFWRIQRKLFSQYYKIRMIIQFIQKYQRLLRLTKKSTSRANPSISRKFYRMLRKMRLRKQSVAAIFRFRSFSICSLDKIEGGRLINFEKRRKEYELLKTIATLQDSCRDSENFKNLEITPIFKTWISFVQVMLLYL